MHHAKKIYKSAPKKQRRQILSPNVVPSRRMKRLINKRGLDADQVRAEAPFAHAPYSDLSGGPIETGDGGLRQAMREAQQIHWGPASLTEPKP